MKVKKFIQLDLKSIKKLFDVNDLQSD